MPTSPTSATASDSCNKPGLTTPRELILLCYPRAGISCPHSKICPQRCRRRPDHWRARRCPACRQRSRPHRFHQVHHTHHWQVASLPSFKLYTDCAIQTLLFPVVESTSSRLRCLPFPASSRFDSTARHSVPAMLVQTATLFLRRRVHARTRDSFDVIIILGYCRYWVDRIKFEINAKFSRVACHIRLLDLP